MLYQITAYSQRRGKRIVCFHWDGDETDIDQGIIRAKNEDYWSPTPGDLIDFRFGSVENITIYPLENWDEKGQKNKTQSIRALRK